MKDYQCYIFDWDGTLMDSISYIVSSIQQAFTVANFPVPTDEEAKSIIGLGLYEAIKQLMPTASDEQCEQIAETYKQQYKLGNKDKLELFNGVHHLLQCLQSQGKVITIATGKSRVGLDSLLKLTNSAHFFADTKTVDEALSKPEPDMIYQILHTAKLEKHQAVMIGDSYFDMKMAENAGIDCIGVTMGAATKESLAQQNPKAIVTSIEELTELIT